MPVLITSTIKDDAGQRPPLVRTAVLSARDRTAYEREILNARRAAEQEDHRLRRLVGDLQRSLLPSVLLTPPGLETAAHYRMASTTHVGGDFYDLSR